MDETLRQQLLEELTRDGKKPILDRLRTLLAYRNGEELPPTQGELDIDLLYVHSNSGFPASDTAFLMHYIAFTSGLVTGIGLSR